MKPTSILYMLLAVIGIAAAVAVPLVVNRSGPAAIPLWTALAGPGKLSAAHSFLGAECASCHTPNRGVEAAACLTCHVTAAPELLTKPSTAFHAGITECAGCHVEHQGRDRRPINMDHAALAMAGHDRAAEAGTDAASGGDARYRHSLARLESLLAASGTDVFGGPLTRRPLPANTRAALDCASCHANRDPHRTQFGRECQSCHNVDKWTIAALTHPSSRSQDCVQCHQAPPSHYMMHFEMMDRTITGQATARVEQCFLCHQTDGWNNIRGIGWYKHH